MARIPTRTSTRELPSSPNALPSVRMQAAPTARDLGGGQTQIKDAHARQDIIGAADHFARATEIIQHRRDRTAVFSALAQAQRDTAQYQAEMAGRKGQFADGETKRTSQWFDEQYESYAGGLQNDRQKRAFDEEWQRLRLNGETAASRHEVTETRAALVEASKATVAGAIELASRTPTDPVALADQRDVVKTASINAAAAAGHKPGSTMAQLEVLKNLSMMHETVAAALLKDDPTAAAEYVKANAGEMNASTFDRVERAVETGKRLRLAQTFADEAQAAGKTEAEAIAAAREKFEGDDERDIVAEIKVRFAEQTAARERMQRAAADEGWQVLAETGSMSGISPMTLAAMDGRDIAAMRRHIQQQIESRERASAAVETRAAARENRAYTRETRELTRRNRAQAEAYDAARMLSITDPGKFASTDWRRQNDKLSFEQIDSLRKLQQKPAVPDFLTYEQQLSRATASMDKEDAATFKMNADEVIGRAMEAKGGELSQKERKDLIDQMEIEFKQDRTFWFDTSVKRGQITPQNRDRVYIPEMPDLPRPAVDAVLGGVPKDKIQGLVREFERRGVPLDTELLIKQYQFETRKK